MLYIQCSPQRAAAIALRNLMTCAAWKLYLFATSSGIDIRPEPDTDTSPKIISKHGATVRVEVRSAARASQNHSSQFAVPSQKKTTDVRTCWIRKNGTSFAPAARNSFGSASTDGFLLVHICGRTCTHIRIGKKNDI